MAMSTTERAKLAGRASAAKRTPEQNKEIGARAARGSAVTRIVRDIHLLTDDQRDRLLRALLA